MSLENHPRWCIISTSGNSPSLCRSSMCMGPLFTLCWRNGWQYRGNSGCVHQSHQKLLWQELQQELIIAIKRLLGSFDLLFSLHYFLKITGLLGEKGNPRVWVAWQPLGCPIWWRLAVHPSGLKIASRVHVTAQQDEGQQREKPLTKGNVPALCWCTEWEQLPHGRWPSGENGHLPTAHVRNVAGFRW